MGGYQFHSAMLHGRSNVRNGSNADTSVEATSCPEQARLAALAEEGDGFRLAEVDLALRKGGEVLGTRQHGYQEFRVARLPDDADLLERAQTVALRTLAGDPALEAPEHALLRDEVAARFGPAREPIPA